LISKTLNQRIRAWRSGRSDFTLVCGASATRGRDKSGRENEANFVKPGTVWVEPRPVKLV